LTFPARGLIGVEYLPPERDGEVRALLICDCGTATDLTVAVDGDREAAFTCGGCLTVHWFTIRVTS
jgi:hypothetical protein